MLVQLKTHSESKTMTYFDDLIFLDDQNSYSKIDL